MVLFGNCYLKCEQILIRNMTPFCFRKLLFKIFEFLFNFQRNKKIMRKISSPEKESYIFNFVFQYDRKKDFELQKNYDDANKIIKIRSVGNT